MRRQKLLTRMLGAGLLLILASAARGARGLPEGVSVVATSGDGVTVRVVAGLPETFVDQQSGRVLIMPPKGWASTWRPGWPELPIVRLHVGIPSGADVHVETAVLSRERMSGIVRAVPSYRDGSETPQPWEDPAFYRRAQPYPSEWAAVEEVGWLREQRVAAVVVQPYRQMPGGVLDVASEILVTVSFTGGERVSQVHGPSAFEAIYRSVLLNYEQASAWRGPPPPKSAVVWDPPYPALKLFVDWDGIYRLSGSWLQDHGLPIDEVNPHTFKLLNRGAEVSLRVDGQDDPSDTVFASSEHVVFWGQHWRDSIPQDTLHQAAVAGEFTRENVYWLTWGGEDGVRFQDVSAAPQGPPLAASFVWTALTEVDSIAPYGQQGEGEGDHITWCWRKFSTRIPYRDEEFPLFIPAPVTEGYQALLRVRMRGYSQKSPNELRYHTGLLLNGTPVDDAWWGTGAEPTYLAEILIQPELLIGDGGDVLTVRLHYDGGDSIYSTICFDWAEVDYRRRYETDGGNLLLRGPAGIPHDQRHDFTAEGPWGGTGGEVLDLSNAVRLTGVEWSEGSVSFGLAAWESTEVALAAEEYFLLPRAGVMEIRPTVPLASASREADYVIISFDPSSIGWSSPNLYNAAVGLRWFWESQGVATTLVDVQDVYDEFHWGVFSPIALRDFLAFAYAYWADAPRSVLFHGDASWDYHGHLGSKRNYVPSLGNPANENFFACVTDTQGAYDQLPDLNVGRWPVETEQQALNMLEKLETYLENESTRLVDFTPWQKRVLFVAGPEGEGFPWFCRHKMASYVLPPPAIARPESVFQEPGGWESQFWNREIRAHVDSGALLMDYYGHGAGLTLGLLFDAVDADSLANEDRLTFLVAITCHAARFANPESTLLGERMLRLDSPEHGAVGVWGSTGLSQVCHPANTAFFEYELELYPLSESPGRFGEATTEGKIEAGAYVAKRYALLCDPEAWIALPTKPDLTLYTDDILLKPAEPGANQRVRILPTLRNQGVAIGADSTAWIRITVESPSGDSTVVGEMETPCVWHLAWTPETPMDWYTTAQTGPHVVRVWVDSRGEIPESREDNNVAELVVDVLHEAPIVSWPQDCALLGSAQVSLVVHSVSLPPGVTEFHYLFEVATADTFVSGMYEYQNSGWLDSGGIVTTWGPPGLVMGETYFWRCRVQADEGDLGAWTEPVSFTLRAEAGTWIQTEAGQFEKDEGSDVDAASSPGDVILASQVSNTDYARLEHGASVDVSSYWEGHTNPDRLIGGGDPEGDFYFAPGDQDQWAVVSWPEPLMLSHVGSRQEAGTMDYAVWSHYRVSTSVDSVTWTEWLELGPFAYPALENIPSIVYTNMLPPVAVRHLRVEFGQCAQNGNGSRVMEIFARVVHFKPDGWLRSVDIGPAAAWDSLWWHSEEPVSTQLRITVRGWDVTSGQWDEILEDLAAPVSLSGIDPTQYPLLQLEAGLATSDSLETPGLKEWAVGFEGIADLLLDPADVSYDSVPWPGAETGIRFAVRNVGLVQVDSVSVALYEQIGDSLVDLEVDTTVHDLLPGGVPRWAELAWTAEQGVHTIVVTVDPTDAVDEGDETNNSVAAVFRVLSDLALQSLSWTPPEVVEGDTLSVSAQVGNLGVVSCPTWSVQFAASAGQDTAWGQVVQGPGALGPGEESVVEASWADVHAGTWLLATIADPDSLVEEISETNNVRSETLQILTMTDLVIGEGDVRLSNPMPPEGDPVTLTAVTRNGGQQPAESVWVAFWEGEPGAEGSVLIGRVGPAAVAGLDSTTFDVEWPTMGQAGDDTLWAVADPDSVVSESREDNNSHWVAVTVSPRPDLLVQGDSLGFVPSSPTVGETLSVVLTVRNSGAAPAGDVVVRLREGLPEQPGDLLAPDVTLVSLGGMESREVRFAFVPDEPGDLDVTAELDPGDEVEESNEANNLCWGRVTVGALADLSVAREDVRYEPSSPVEGQVVQVEARVRNLGAGGAGAFSVGLWIGDPVMGALVDTAGVDTLPPGTNTDLEWSWNTAGQGGYRELCIVADVREVVHETQEDNNRVSVAVEVIPDTTAPVLVLERGGFLAGDYLEPPDTLLVRGSDAGSGLDAATLTVLWDADVVSLDPQWDLPETVLLLLPVPETLGAHEYVVSIADLAENADTLRVPYRVGGSLRIVEVMPYPNPAPGHTAFVLGTTRSGDVTVDVYSLSGRLVRRIGVPLRGTRVAVPWDGADEDGDAVANGVYLYRVTVDNGEEKVTQLGRLVVWR